MHPWPKIGLSPPDLARCNLLILQDLLAGSTGLEPAASGVTGRRSNQLNYDPKRMLEFRMRNSEFRCLCLPSARCHCELFVRLRAANHVALRRDTPSPVSARARACAAEAREGVGGTGFEPVTAGV
jgi:hypothetical protein